MKIVVVGGGRVGLPVAAGLAVIGHRVVCCERDAARRRSAASGRAPFADKGLDDALLGALKSGALTFCSTVAQAVGEADAVIIAIMVDHRNGERELNNLAAEVVSVMPPRCILIVKSTVQPGTCSQLQKAFGIHVVANPEFLRQGHGFGDFLSPFRIIVGGDKVALKIMRNIYAPMIERGAEYIETDCVSAEIAKLASNMFLSSRTALINETADLCEAAGGDIALVARAIAADKRIGGENLRPSIGFGGACLPKDGCLLMESARRFNADMLAAAAVYDSNRRRMRRIAERIFLSLPRCPVVAVWGVACKPDADSVCESPAVAVMRDLQSWGGRIQAYEPTADMAELRKEFPFAVFAKDKMAALAGADVLAVMNKSKFILGVSPTAVVGAMKNPVVFDFVGIFDRVKSKKAGMTLRVVGMPLIKS